MKLSILNQKKEDIGKLELPSQFQEEVRPDLIKRAIIAIHYNDRQPYGADLRAGKKASAKVSRRRHSYKTSYGLGISRVPRKIMSKRGTRMNWVGAVAPGTVGGRRAHPPKADRIWDKKVNRQERRKAIRSAIAATVMKDQVAQNHILPQEFPFIIDASFESLAKTKEMKTALLNLGLGDELARVAEKTIRSGRGKARGRRYKAKTGPLIVVSKDCSAMKAAKNIPGISVAKVTSLNVKILASGINPGRLTLWTQAAITELDKKKLFI